MGSTGFLSSTNRRGDSSSPKARTHRLLASPTGERRPNRPPRVPPRALGVRHAGHGPRGHGVPGRLHRAPSERSGLGPRRRLGGGPTDARGTARGRLALQRPPSARGRRRGQGLQHDWPGLPGLHPGRRSVRRRPRRLPGLRRQPVREPVERGAGLRRDRSDGHPVAGPTVRVSARSARDPDIRRIDGELLGHRHGSPDSPGRGFPPRHALRLRADPRFRCEVGRPGRVPRGERAKGSVRIGARDRPGSVDATDQGGSRCRVPAVLPGRERRHDQYGRGRRHRRLRGGGPAGRPVAACRRRLRWILSADGPGAGAFSRDRGRRLHRARPAQGDVPALRDGVSAGSQRSPPPRRPPCRCRLPAGPGAGGRDPELHRLLARAVP